MPGKLYLARTDAKPLDATTPLLIDKDFAEAAYWVDDQGLLYVALSKGPLPRSGGPDARESFYLTLALEDPPAGLGRNYAAKQRTLRAIRHQAAQHERFASRGGVVSVWRGRGGRLDGKFRIHCRGQEFQFPLGWAFDAEYLLLGEFSAVPDASFGRRVLEATESGGLERPPYRPGPVIIEGPDPTEQG